MLCQANYSGICAGAISGSCSPHVVWGTLVLGSDTSSGHFGGGALGVALGYYGREWAFSVRCRFLGVFRLLLVTIGFLRLNIGVSSVLRVIRVLYAMSKLIGCILAIYFSFYAPQF